LVSLWVEQRVALLVSAQYGPPDDLCQDVSRHPWGQDDLLDELSMPDAGNDQRLDAV